MKQSVHILLAFVLLLFATGMRSQSASPSPYCNGTYSSGQCNQGGPSNTPGNWVNDFIDNFITSGGNSNISNIGSGCNGNANNYINYCSYYLSVTPGQVITCTLQSGILYAQGFAIYVDWDQNNVFSSSEQVTATNGFPAAATPTVLSFTIPAGQPNGAYRMRVRSSFATSGLSITPCGPYSYGETEDYTLYVGPPVSPSGGILSAGSNATICAGQSFSLNAVLSGPGVGIVWTGPSAFTSTLSNIVFTNAQASASGVYTVTPQGVCPIPLTVNVLVAPTPVYSITPANPTICQGGNTILMASFLNGASASLYTYSWTCYPPPNTLQSSGPGAGISAPGSQITMVSPSPIIGTQATLIYSLVVTPTVLNCPVAQTVALTINNPLTPALTIPATLCNTVNPVMLSASPGGGTWSSVPASPSVVSPNGLFNPAIASTGTNHVMYSVSVGTCIVSSYGAISVAHFNAPLLTNTIMTQCAVMDPAVDLMSVVQNTAIGGWVPVVPYLQSNYFNPNSLATGSYALTFTTPSSPASLANVCPGSTVLTVPVFNPPSPVIAPIPVFCNNASTLQLSATPTLGLLWTGNTGVSSTGVLTPSACGIYNSITATSGLGTCVASSSTTFIVPQFRSAALTGTVPNQCITNNPFNLMSIVQNTTGSWYLGTAPALLPLLNNVFNPSAILTGTVMNFNLTYSTSSYPLAGLCNDSRTIAVTVLNPPSPNIISVGPFCNLDGPVQLTVTPNTGVWSVSSFLNHNGVFTPSLCPVGNNIVQYIIGTSTCNTQQTAIISVEAFVPATITSSISDQCVTNAPVNLQPYTINTQGSWMGSGVLGASFNPSVSGTGQTVLTYTTASSPSGLCPDQATVAVNVYSLATPVFSNIRPVCSSSLPFQLMANPVNGLFGGANTGAVDPQGIFNPATARIGDNIVNYSITSGPCVAHSQATINVEQFVAASFISTAGPFCKNDPLLARNLNEIVSNPGGSWNGSGVDENGLFTFTKANIGSNVVNYMTHSSTATLCPDFSTLQIVVYDTPDVQISASASNSCVPATIKLYPNINYGEGSWDFGDGAGKQSGLAIDHYFTTPGTYSVLFTYSVDVATNLKCISQSRLSNNIRIYNVPEADFISTPGADQIDISSPKVHFRNTSTQIDQNRYQWTFAGDTGKSVQNDIDAVYIFPEVGNYNVTLTATNLNGCKASVSKNIEVKTKFNVYIPSSFTPNGDGLNDTFYPVFSEYGVDNNGYLLQIFDRWGALLFETADKDQHWDGKQGGHSLKEDVYVFRIKYKDTDGNTFNKSGQVTILR